MTARIGVLLAGVFSCGALAQNFPKAENILDRYIEVTGGRAIYEMRKTEVSIAKFEMPAQGISGTMTVFAKAPDTRYSLMEIEGVGRIEAGVIDGVAWEKSFGQSPRLRDGAERADALRDAVFNAPLQWRKLYQKVETVAMEPVNGEDCYKVDATPAEGAVESTWFSKKSGLVLKRARVAKSATGEVPVEFLTADYREFNGLLMATKVMQRTAGAEFLITLDSLRVNEKLGPERFDPPADVKALFEKPATDGKQPDGKNRDGKQPDGK